MSADLFPSGPWVGFYNYTPKDKHGRELNLAFAGGRLTGDGRDDVGEFRVLGGYDVAAKECWWTKTYLGAHSVFYRGYREGKGIWGVWEITAFDHGGFHIWPRESGLGGVRTESIHREEPAGETVVPQLAPAVIAFGRESGSLRCGQ